MDKKVLLTVIITFVVTVFLTSYVIYLFQADKLAVGLSRSDARLAPPPEDTSEPIAAYSFGEWLFFTITEREGIRSR